MDFTREPIIETIITPREGYRLAVRSSKSMGQEEHFVDAVEVVSFGSAFFFRSLERPKPFVVPVGDYEILEVREPRMVLKTPTHEGSVKIGGGQDRQPRAYRDESRRESQRDSQRDSQREMQRESQRESQREAQREAQRDTQREPQAAGDVEKEESYAREGRNAQAAPVDSRAERRRDRRRGFRRRGRDGARPERERQEGRPEDRPEGVQGDQAEEGAFSQAGETESAHLMMGEKNSASRHEAVSRQAQIGDQLQSSTLLRSVLPPPTTLVSKDLERLRESEVYRGAFFIREEAGDEQDDDDSSLESIGSDVQFQTEMAVKKESSFEEEPFLFSQAAEAKVQSNLSKDIP